MRRRTTIASSTKTITIITTTMCEYIHIYTHSWKVCQHLAGLPVPASKKISKACRQPCKSLLLASLQYAWPQRRRGLLPAVTAAGMSIITESIWPRANPPFSSTAYWDHRCAHHSPPGDPRLNFSTTRTSAWPRFACENSTMSCMLTCCIMQRTQPQLCTWALSCATNQPKRAQAEEGREGRERDREEKYRRTDRLAGSLAQTNGQTDTNREQGQRHRHRQAGRQAGRRQGRQTGREADRQKERERERDREREKGRVKRGKEEYQALTISSSPPHHHLAFDVCLRDACLLSKKVLTEATESKPKAQPPHRLLGVGCSRQTVEEMFA